MPTNFYLESRANARNENPVRLSVIIGGSRFVTSSGHSVFADCWNSDAQNARGRRASDPVNAKGHTAARLNADLSRIAAYWQAIEAKAEGKLTGAELRTFWDEFRGKKAGAAPCSADEFMREYEKAEGRSWADGTRTKWHSFTKILKASGVFSSADDLAKPEKAAAFAEHLRSRQKDTTAGKYFSMLCRLIRYGESRGKFAAGTADQMKKAESFRAITQPVVYLTAEQLSAFLSFDPSTVAGHSVQIGKKRRALNPETLGRVRSLFCFCALTSLRVSDALALTWEQVGADALTVTTQKTADRLTIEINKPARRILEERKAAQGLSSGRVFDPVNAATMNAYIKALGALCGASELITRDYIKKGRRVTETRPKYELLSSHAGRRTFIVTALSFGVAPAVVMKITGHSTFDAMRPYIDITEKARAQALAKFDTLGQS